MDWTLWTVTSTQCGFKPWFYWGFVVLYYSSSVLCLVNNHLSICLFCFGYCVVCPSVSFPLTCIFQYTLLLLPGKEPDSLIECIWVRYYIYHAGYIKIILRYCMTLHILLRHILSYYYHMLFPVYLVWLNQIVLASK